MTTSWERVSEVFEAASALPPDERAAFLATAGAGDANLVSEVASLLAAAAPDGPLDRLRSRIGGDTSG